MTTYIGLATRFPDYFLLDIVGDESPVTRKMMVDMKVRMIATILFLPWQLDHIVPTLYFTGQGNPHFFPLSERCYRGHCQWNRHWEAAEGAAGPAS